MDRERARIETERRIEELRRGIDGSSSIWLLFGGGGVLACLLGTWGGAMGGIEFGMGITVSVGLVVYGLHAKDKEKKSLEEMERLRRLIKK